MHLICQGETRANRRSRFPANDALSDAARIALSRMKVDIRPGSKVWIAPELAAQQTAAGFNTAGNIVRELAEPDYGLWTGLPVKEVMTNNREAFHRWLSGEAPPGGESISELVGRTGEWLSRNVCEREHHCVIVSAAVIRAMITGLLNAPVSSFRRLDIAPLSRTILTSNGKRWDIQLQSEADRNRYEAFVCY